MKSGFSSSFELCQTEIPHGNLEERPKLLEQQCYEVQKEKRYRDKKER